MCPTAQTYQDHQRQQGVEGTGLGGLYTRIVINDFLPQYPGRAPFQPGLSEFGATKSWTGSPMASLQRAVLMLRKLNLHGIPWDIRNSLRQLQDAYSEELDFSGSDTSSQASIEPDVSEQTNLEDGEAGKEKYKGRESKAKSQQSRANQRSASGNWEQDVQEHIINKDARRALASEDEDHSETNLLHPRLCHQDVDCALQQGNSSSRLWRWGPSATSEDAAKFFRRVL